MQTYPELTAADQWRLLCWMVAHPAVLAEDMAPAVALHARRLQAPRAQRKGGRRTRRLWPWLVAALLAAVWAAAAR